MRTRRAERTRPGLLLLVACLIHACAPIRGAPSRIRRRAELDLHCPAKRLSYAKPGPDTYDARGCNRQVRYVRACREGDCEWRQDAPPQTVGTTP